MATLRRGLVDKVKKAAAKVSTRGVQVATQAGTRGARALVETTVAAVKTVDKLQEKLGRRTSQARKTEEPVKGGAVSGAARPKAATKGTGATAQSSVQETASPRNLKDAVMRKASVAKTAEKAAVAEKSSPKSRRASTAAQPVTLREAGRKTMPGTAPKRSKASAQTPGFKVKRGQKHRHTGR